MANEEEDGHDINTVEIHCLNFCKAKLVTSISFPFHGGLYLLMAVPYTITIIYWFNFKHLKEYYASFPLQNLLHMWSPAISKAINILM